MKIEPKCIVTPDCPLCAHIVLNQNYSTSTGVREKKLESTFIHFFYKHAGIIWRCKVGKASAL